LDVTPAQFGQAAAEGARVNLQRQELAQHTAQANAQLGMEQQRLDASERQAAMEAQIRRETLVANFQRSQTQAAVAQAYHQATLGIAKNRLNLESQKLQQATQDKASTLADRQNYAMSIAGGMSPAEALAKYPRAWEPGLASGVSKPGPEETMTRHSTSDAVASKPATTSQIGLLSRLGITTGITPGTPYKRGTEKTQLTESVKVPVGTDPASAFRAAQPAPAPAAPAAASASNLPKAGDVVNGYTFKGGELTDPKNWEAVPASQ
jgi:hypothetical protein